MARFLTTLLMMFSLNSFADVEVPVEIPVEKCEGLEVALDSFAKDVTDIDAERGIAEEISIENFSSILVEVTVALADIPADCDYAVKFVKRKHQEMLDTSFEDNE